MAPPPPTLSRAVPAVSAATASALDARLSVPASRAVPGGATRGASSSFALSCILTMRMLSMKSARTAWPSPASLPLLGLLR